MAGLPGGTITATASQNFWLSYKTLWGPITGFNDGYTINPVVPAQPAPAPGATPPPPAQPAPITDPGVYLQRSKLYLRNNMVPEAKEAIDNAVRLMNTSGMAMAAGQAPAGAQTSNDGPEIDNLANIVIPPILQWDVQVNPSIVRETDLIEQVPSWIDSNGDGRQQSWESPVYDSNGKPVYMDRASHRRATGKSAAINTPTIPIWLGFNAQTGLQFSSLDYNHTADSTFHFYPYVDPEHPEYTPKYLTDLYGTQLTSMEMGPIYTQNGHVNFSWNAFKLSKQNYFKWFSWISFFANRVGAQYDVTHTGTRITAHPDYEYSEVTGRLRSVDPISQNFGSFRYDRTTYVETQNMPLLFTWPNTFYLTGMFQRKDSSVSGRTMTDIYELGDKNFSAPTYYMDNPFTEGERDTMEADYATYVRERLANARKRLGAREDTIGIRLDSPGAMQWLKLFGFADSTLKDGIDENMNFSLQRVFQINDSIMGTTNGLYPTTRDFWAPYVKYHDGDTNRNNIEDGTETWKRDSEGNYIYLPATKNGSNYHADLPVYNTRTWRMGVSYKLRLGLLQKMIEAPYEYAGGFFDKPNPQTPGATLTGYFGYKFFYTKGATPADDKFTLANIPRALWLIPSLVYPIPRTILSLIDDGNPKGGKPELYIPVEYTYSTTKGKLGDDSLWGQSRLFGIGIGIGKNFQVMWKTSLSETLRTPAQSKTSMRVFNERQNMLVLTWRF